MPISRRGSPSREIDGERVSLSRASRMEDSYTVHRRRKAAARRREKTPEPSSAGLAVVTDDDDVAVVVSEEHLTETGKKEEEKIKPDKEEAATRTTKIAASSAGETMDTDEENERRARMERMVEDTERMELMMGEEEEQRPRASAKARQQQLDVADEATVKTRPRSPASANRPEKAELPVREEESSKGLEPPAVSRKAESPARGNREEQEQQQPEREETEPPQPPVKVSRKPREPPSNGDQLRKKMGSPEAVKVQREPSNGADLRKRMGSPEAAKTRESSDGAELRKRMRSPEVAKSRESSDGTELRKRLGSPEAAKMRARHLSPSSRAPDFNEDENNIKRASSRQRYQQPSDEEEPPAALVQQHRTRRSPSQPPKKQIIPLSDNSLIEDVARAKRAYAHREPSDDYEYEDDEEEEEEEEYVPRRKRDTTVRRRKTSIIHTDREKEEIRKTVGQTSSWFSWIPFFGNKRQQIDNMIQENEKHKKKEKEDNEESTKKSKLEKTPSTIDESRQKKSRIREFLGTVREINAEFKEFCRQNPEEVQILYELRNLCIVDTLITIIVCGLGGLAFRFTEGAFESFYKCGVKRVKRDFLDTLWNYSHNMKEDDWKSMARRKLMDFEEQLHAAHEAGVQTYSGQRSWTFLNAVVYCLTIISTIGYGHISPSTTTGRALTIIYAIFGIPMFLIVLADFGKLFTRGIKFLWAFVRRLYYTGSCRQVRRTVPMQEMMKGVQLVYDLATFRRPSQMTPEELEEMQRQQKQTVLSLDGNAPQQPDSPSTPAMSTFEIDDEFNLPISVAITILVLYIFIGATVFNIVEDWTFFESFYFVFISMSTIGFGDFVPQEPLYMMLSIVYLIFGLALTSMCINVVQVMLTDQFKHASQKIGASIGFHVSDEDGSLRPAPPEPVEIAEVHNASTPEEKEKIAPKAKQEDVDL